MRTLSLALLLAFVKLPFVLWSSGYIHPDQVRQSVDIVASFSWNNISSSTITLPWEWNLQAGAPVRSFLNAYLTAGIPMLCIKYLAGTAPIPAQVYLIAVRGWCWLIATATELIFASALAKLLKETGMSSKTPMMILAFSTSWPSVVLATRPFSNAIEALGITAGWAALLHASAPISKSKLGVGSAKLDIALGVGLTFVAWIRFSALLVIAPMGLWWMSFSVSRGAPALSRVLLSGAFTAISLIIADSMFFGLIGTPPWMPPSVDHRTLTSIIAKSSDPSRLDAWWWQLQDLLRSSLGLSLSDGLLVATPLHAAAYNVRSAGADHGWHPWWYHPFVYLPLMLGPLIYARLLLHLFLEALAFVWGTNPPKSLSSAWATTSRRFLMTIVVCGAGGLSLSDHAEPRFLLPLVAPSTVIALLPIPGNSFPRIRSLGWIATTVSMVGWSVGLVFFFGVLHQGGVIPATASIPPSLDAHNALDNVTDIAVVYGYSYSPPAAWLALSPQSLYKNVTFHVFDEAGSIGSGLHELLLHRIPAVCPTCSQAVIVLHDQWEFSSWIKHMFPDGHVTIGPQLGHWDMSMTLDRPRDALLSTGLTTTLLHLSD